ncbi:hypothetical protein DL93DRAFT_2102344 [Clavulina sp. PMI_390]|nr:hypothetical protein DL93DRAFT_2102344 [Clavulina sp. PMI_390]
MTYHLLVHRVFTSPSVLPFAPTTPSPLIIPKTPGTQGHHRQGGIASDVCSLQVASSSAYPVTPPLPSASPLQPLPDRKAYFHYQLFLETSGLRSRFACDPENESIGRIQRNRVSPPHTAMNVKRFIAQYESWPHLLHLTEIWSDISARFPMTDDEFIAVDEGAPGTTPQAPLVITIRNSGITDQEEPILTKDYAVAPPPPSGDIYSGQYPTPRSTSGFVFPTPPPAPSGVDEQQWSPFLLPSPALSVVDNNRSTAVSIASQELVVVEPLEEASQQTQISPTRQAAVPSTPLVTSLHQRRRSSTNRSGIEPWRIDETGFGEPTMHPTEVGRVMSHRKPPGWISGEVSFLSWGLFMSKMDNQLPSGTIIRNGMKVWGDIRTERRFKLKEDTFGTFRVILADTREIVDLWTGDLTWDAVQR